LFAAEGVFDMASDLLFFALHGPFRLFGKASGRGDGLHKQVHRLPAQCLGVDAAALTPLEAGERHSHFLITLTRGWIN